MKTLNVETTAGSTIGPEFLGVAPVIAEAAGSARGGSGPSFGSPGRTGAGPSLWASDPKNRNAQRTAMKRRSIFNP
jgi:hypothetical protein